MAFAVLVVTSSACSSGGDAAYGVHDATDATGTLATVFDPYLQELSDEGWHLYLYLFGSEATIDDPASLGVDIERPTSDDVAGGTLVLLSAASQPPRFAIRGPGGGLPQGRAAGIAPTVEARVTELLAQPGTTESPASAFIFAVAESAGIDLRDVSVGLPPSSSVDEDEGIPAWVSLVALIVVIGVPLRVIPLLWRYRHDAGSITPVSDLKAGTAALVEGVLVCDDPIHLPSVDLWAAYTCTTQQHMGKRVDNVEWLEQKGDFTFVNTTKVATETGWRDGKSSTFGAWFKVNDGTGQVWVSGEGAKVDGHYVGASERRGGRRTTLHAVLINERVAVQGPVHEAEDGTLVIGGAKGKLKHGFLVSVLPAKKIARRGKRAALVYAVGGVAFIVLAAVVGLVS
jgi:hypothetical protein